MARGDQIYVMRELAGIPGVYEHHGIDCGDGTVIHYRKTGDEAVVARTTFETFAQGNPVYPKLQPVSFVPDVVLERAESRLGERRYDLFYNNCEHFVTWCKTGRSESPQLTDFGLNLDQLRLPELRRLIENTAQDRTPEQAIVLFQKALGDIAGAYQTLRIEEQEAQAEINTWQRVAERALQKQREDLARAALHKKVAAKKRAEFISSQLAELVEIQLNLLRNREISEERFRLG